MHIALYQGFQSFHYEMLGYMYDFCITHNISFDVYAHMSPLWKPFYDEHFGAKDWNYPQNLDVSKYDYVVLLTDDDNTFPKKHFEKYSTKIISIDHCHQIRNGHVKARIGTRPIDLERLWAIPCFRPNLTKQVTHTSVAIVGDSNSPVTHAELKSIFKNYDSIKFHVIGYNMSIDATENITCYRNLDAISMYQILSTCSYMLCFLRGKDYINSILSGSIALAYSTCCRLIIPSIAKEKLGLTTPLCLEHVEGTDLSNVNDLILEEIAHERDRLIQHRNKTMLQVLVQDLGSSI